MNAQKYKAPAEETTVLERAKLSQTIGETDGLLDKFDMVVKAKQAGAPINSVTIKTGEDGRTHEQAIKDSKQVLETVSKKLDNSLDLARTKHIGPKSLSK